MIYLPSSPAIGGTRLAAYIAADPARSAIFDQIVARLGPVGRVGDEARLYIIDRPERRAVFRGILISLAMLLPEWSKEHAAARRRNRQFRDRCLSAHEAANVG